MRAATSYMEEPVPAGHPVVRGQNYGGQGSEKNFNQQALDMLCASSAEFWALALHFVLVTAM